MEFDNLSWGDFYMKHVGAAAKIKWMAQYSEQHSVLEKIHPAGLYSFDDGSHPRNKYKIGDTLEMNDSDFSTRVTVDNIFIKSDEYKLLTDNGTEIIMSCDIVHDLYRKL